MELAKCPRSRRWVGFLGVLLTLSLILPGPASVGNSSAHAPGAAFAVVEPTDTAYAPGQLIVKLSDASALRMLGENVASLSPALGDVVSCFNLHTFTEVLPNVYELSALEGSELDVPAAADALRATGVVAYAEPNYSYHITRTPNDPQYLAQQQWGITQIKAEEAWDITTGADNIVIAVLDTGTATDHPDLAEKIVPGYNFVHRNNNPYDDEGHGTQTAGVAAASSNNGIGIVGVSWGARIMPVKVINSRGSGSDSSVASGIRWATDNGARVINASLGGDFNTATLRDAVQYAADRNVLLVASAGNTPDGKPNYPAAYESVLAVGATGRNDTYTGFSSWGPYVDVTAPGVGILSTAWNDGALAYDYNNGTSFSAPFVAGLAALVWSINPSFTAAQVKQIIEDSSDDLGPPGFDENYGLGRVNAVRAVRMAQQGPPPPRTPTPVGQTPPTPLPGGTPPPQGGPTLQVDSREVGRGALIALTATGFGPNEYVDLTFTFSDNSARAIGNAQAGAQGAFRAEIAMPANAPLGRAVLTASGVQTGRSASAEMNVRESTGAGQSSIRGTVTGVTDPTQVTVHLRPSVGVRGSEQTKRPDSFGTFSFSNLAAGIYVLSATAPGNQTTGPVNVQVSGSLSDIRLVDLTFAKPRPSAFDRVAPVTNSPTLVYFPEVGHTLRGPFLRYWQQNGGLAIFGYPISEEFQEVSATDGKTYVVQYFERNRFEHHPEFAGSRNEVLMGLLGVEMTKGRTFPPGTPFRSDANRVFFPETQHSLSSPFLRYWQQNGGLAIFGYPISEPMQEVSPTDGKTYLVQYFERNRFEYHPEFAGSRNEVLLGLLGVEVAKRNGWIAP